MKKLILSVAAVAALSGSLVVLAQGQTAPAPSTETGPVGLIDMAHVFKNYDKFKVMTEDLQKQIQQSEAELKSKAENLKALAQKAQEVKQTFKEDSPEFLEHEKQFTAAQTEFDSLRKTEQREFLRKEAQIYKTIYLEVSDAVEQAAKHYGYSVVLRFSREEIDTAGDPKELIQSMNRQVVYHSKTDDITEPVLLFLNKNYNRTNGAAATGAAAPATPAASAPKAAARK